MTCGELVKEGDMKLHGAKGERRVFLFDKLIMITKLREDGFFFCKCVIEVRKIEESYITYCCGEQNEKTSSNQHHTRFFAAYVCKTHH